MKPFSISLPISWYIYLHLFTLFTLSSLWFRPNKTTASSTSGNQTEYLSLLKFNESISSDPHGILSSWNSSTHFCNWHGITCNPKHQRVTKLNLQGYNLHGFISPHVGNLSFLRILDLGNNSFYGKIPQELGQLLQLKKIILINNSFAGEIPTNLSSCTNLNYLDLYGNNLTGKIPVKFGSLSKLQTLYLSVNRLTGRIPSFIGNLSSLMSFSATTNKLEGEIPKEICCLKKLTTIELGANRLCGNIPPCLFNISSLTVFSIAVNQLNGSLPPNMFHTLPNLELLEFSMNQISGPIPSSITNASALQILEIGSNHFVGQVPNLSKLKNLFSLTLNTNNLGGNSTKDLEFLKSLRNCSKLQWLDISENNFGGTLPNFIGNLSTQLSYLLLESNHISGKFPIELGNFTSLTLLAMAFNHFEGTIPTVFCKLPKMQMLSLRGNKLVGDIPTCIGNLSQLFYCDLAQNLLGGSIPQTIGQCKMLQYLNLGQNNLSGTIPLEVFSLFSLTNSLDLSQNSLSGSLPNEVSQLKNIEKMDVSENHLSSQIPGAIGECTSMEYLYFQGNSFYGIIPTTLASLKGLQHLDISRNYLSGLIPQGLENIPFLVYFNASFNMLDGEVPTKGIFRNSSGLSVKGNTKLCGGISQLHLPSCPINSKKLVKNHHSFKLIVAIVSASLFLFIALLTIFWMRKRNKKTTPDSPTIDQLPKVSYQNLHNGTNGFSNRNLIGSGNFGYVYKGTLESEDDVVAIKVLNLQKKGARKSFIVECNALKNIRHRNLVKVLTCCSSANYKGEEFKALVFEYMQNGSLESWLHSPTDVEDQHRSLDLEQRFNIIIDVASAMHYLHYECEQTIIHCDLKPNNVLLDDCMVAHVSDFGLARLLSSIGISLIQSSTIGIKGTIGYAPPEYGMGFEISIEGDMYSFGILVLEMLTGRRPADEMFKDGYNLHNHVEIAISDNRLLHIVDPTILPNNLEQATNSENHGFMHPNVEKCLLPLFRIALACSVDSPKKRMNMLDVIRELNLIKSSFPFEL